jgi:uncharacterized protein YbjT (DUF2867 family)
MKIVVIGGSGLIGSKLVEKLRADGHDPLAASPDSGVDTLTGEGLADALEGAEVVVDVSNAPAWDDATQFYEFIGRIADSSTDGNTVYLPPVLIQPEAADDVAAALADAAASAPVNGTVELAGPERFRLDELPLRPERERRRTPGDGRPPRSLLRRRTRRPLPHPAPTDALHGLAQPIHGRAHEPQCAPTEMRLF